MPVTGQTGLKKMTGLAARSDAVGEAIVQLAPAEAPLVAATRHESLGALKRCRS
jgi:hypothetical protein